VSNVQVNISLIIYIFSFLLVPKIKNYILKKGVVCKFPRIYTPHILSTNIIYFSSDPKHSSKTTQKTTQTNKETMTFSTFLNFLFPPPPSLFITTMSVITCVSLANAGFNEVRGKHLNYSKFWNVDNNNGDKKKKKMMKLSSKSGMLLLYTPAFVAGAASFLVFPDDGFRSLVLQGAVTFHFFKRVFEVMYNLWFNDAILIALLCSKFFMLKCNAVKHIHSSN